MAGYKIKFNGVDRVYDEYSWRLTRRAKQAWQTGLVVGNKSHGHTALFEDAMAKYTKRKFAIAVGSGTDALYFSLKAKGIGPGSSVLCPAVSYMATAEAIKRTGATIHFVDVDSTGLISKLPDFGLPNAVVYVNLFGNLADYATLKEFCAKRRIPLIEDAAQSLGSYYNKVPSGKLGDISSLSFLPSKPLPAFANGGMVLTDNEDEAQFVRGLRYHGYNGVNTDYGYNSCIPESVASQLNFLLGKYKTFLKHRTKIYKQYCETLKDTPITFFKIRENCVSNHSKLVVQVPNRDELATYLQENGIQTGLTYKTPLPRMKMFTQDKNECPGADTFCDTNIALPIYPFLKQKEIEFICDKIKQFYV